MDHQTIEEQQTVARYLRGELPPAEAARFEEHYVACPECLDRLELEEAMARGFKRAAGQDAARRAAGRQLALVAWLARLGRSRQMAALAMAALLVAVLPGLLALHQVQERGRELAAARTALEQERARAAQGAPASAAAEQLRRDLAREQAARAQADADLAAARRPQANVPLLFLDPERGGGEPTHRLRLPREPGWIVLALQIEPPHQPSYRAVLRDAHDREIWRGDGLRVNEMDALSLSLPSTLLAPGDYSLTVEPAAGRFTFRALR
jgi:hypothetical protein